MLDNRTINWMYFLVGIVYLTGIIVPPLMEPDAAQHASVAMRMYVESDFVNIINRFEDYLDKPHLLFWLSSISYSLFGISAWAYRLPSVLVTFMGAYATFRLGSLLYNRNVGKLSALVFLTTQATILGNHDVRMDALLTGTVIVAIWQLAEFLDNNKLKHMLIGSLALAMGFSTKGQIAVFTAGIALLCHAIYLHKWNTFYNWKWLIGLVVFFIAISPVLYSYYLQFDLHPEKIIKGQMGVSGVRFILWDQSFNRLTGGQEFLDNPDYFFLHHSFLWAFLPWTLMALGAIIYRFRDFVKVGFRKAENLEFLTLGGALIVFSIISFSRFKLPHYINILFPLFSILTAQYLYRLQQKNQNGTLKFFLYFQYALGLIFLILLIILNMWSFPIDNLFWGFSYGIFLIMAAYLVLKPTTNYSRIVVITVLIGTFTNFVLNTNFYPKLIKYQSGSELARMAKREGIPSNNIYCFDHWSKSLDFYAQRIIPEITLNELNNRENDHKIWIFTYQEGFDKLKESGITWDRMYSADHYAVTQLSAKFLNPNTRPETLGKAYLLEVNLTESPAQ